MIVKEMIAKLSLLEPNLPIYFVADGFGDHIYPRNPGGIVSVVSFRGSEPHECLLLFSSELLADPADPAS
jgi:hypothetical protein